MGAKQLQFKEKYLKALQALQELIDCDKTIETATAITDENRKVTLMLDIWASKVGEENVMRKVYDFIPDFILEEE